MFWVDISFELSVSVSGGPGGWSLEVRVDYTFEVDIDFSHREICMRYI